MVDARAYPYPTYVPNQTTAGCVAAVVSISLIAWLVQSYQLRFRPPRLCFLLLISHTTICIELIVRATVPSSEQSSRIVFIIINTLFAMGQRMIIVGNFVFVMQLRHEKSRRSRNILLAAVLCVITSGALIAPANMLSFDSDHISLSYLFRELSASLLLAVTLFFYPVWYWSRTVKDMNIQAILLLTISSVMCVTVAIFNAIQSLSAFYTTINGDERWFYGLQMTPIIIAHFTWSILHPKRSLISLRSSAVQANGEDMLTNQERSSEITLVKENCLSNVSDTSAK